MLHKLYLSQDHTGTVHWRIFMFEFWAYMFL